VEPAEVKHRLLAERTGRKGIQRWRDRSSLPIKRNPIDFFHLLSGEQKLFRLLTEILRTVRNWCCYFCYCYYWWCTLVPLVISFCTRIPWRHNWMTESLLPDEEMRLYDFRWRARHPHSIYFPSFLRSLCVYGVLLYPLNRFLSRHQKEKAHNPWSSAICMSGHDPHGMSQACTSTSEFHELSIRYPIVVNFWYSVCTISWSFPTNLASDHMVTSNWKISSWSHLIASLSIWSPHHAAFLLHANLLTPNWHLSVSLPIFVTWKFVQPMGSGSHICSLDSIIVWKHTFGF
jgi:hypothetical protein